jgi:hypothetical protein
MKYTDFVDIDDEPRRVPPPEGQGCAMWLLIAFIAVVTILLIGINQL